MLRCAYVDDEFFLFDGDGCDGLFSLCKRTCCLVGRNTKKT